MRRKFSEGFKAEAVRLVLEQGLSVSQAARDLEVAQSTLDKWVSAAKEEQRPEALTAAEREELQRLR